MMNFLSEKLSKRNSFYISLIISTLFVYPLINAGVYYIDDIPRSQTGYVGWFRLGRPLSEYIYTILSLGQNIAIDVSPLPQMLSILVMAWCIQALSNAFFAERTLSTVAISSLAFISPLFLHNMAYKYDSLSMALSVASCAIAFSIDLRNKLINYIFKGALIFSSLCLYQVSGVIYLMLCIAKSIKNIANGQAENFKSIFKPAILTLASYASYMVWLKANTTTSRSGTVLSVENGKYIFIGNIEKFANMYCKAFDPLTTKILFLVATLSIISYAYKAFLKKQPTKKLAATLVSLSLLPFPAIMIILASSTTVILSESLIVPRIATPFGVVLMSVLAVIYCQSKKTSGLIAGYFLAVTILTSFALANAIKSQYEVDFVIVSQIKKDISGSPKLSSSKTTTFGVMKESPVVAVNSQVFPVIRLINSKMYDASTSTMLTRLGIRNVNFSFERAKWQEIANDACSVSYPDVSTTDYSIYNKDGQNYVFLGGKPKLCK
ncbi:glucosyltransferase domain-containing protein [Cronobacter sakazakii]|nr:glucosyltransferase domain-containing protein [Cronobacter sakazakii]